MLLLLLYSAILRENPHSTVDAILSHHFATLTPETARQLDGKTGRFRIALDSEEWVEGGRVIFDCESQDGILRSVYLPPGEYTADVMEVDAVLRVIHHRPSGGFRGVTEYRLEAH